MVNPTLNKIKNNEFHKLRINKEKEAIELLKQESIEEVSETEEEEVITVKYEGEKYIITATETKPNSNLFNYTVYSKQYDTTEVFKNQPIFKEHNNDSEFAQYTLTLLEGDLEIQKTNFGQALKNLNKQYEEQKVIRNQKTFENKINEVFINGKICYINNNNNQYYLNWYNPSAKSYDTLPVNNKEDTLKWLRKFNNPQTTEESKKIINDNTLLWNNINRSQKEIENLNNNNQLIIGLDSINKENKTTYLVKLLKLNGFVICTNNNELYRFDKSKGGYIHYNNIEYLQFVEEEISSKLQVPLVNEVVQRSLNSLRTYKPIHHNILVFKNGYYDTDTWTFTKNKKYTSGIPYYNFDYNYNPNAELGEYGRLYWNNYKEQLQTDLLETTGLLLVKGNPLKKLWFIVGITDSGKTVFINILTYILKKISNLSLTTINKEGHELESLLDSNINIMNDEAKDMITNESIIKKLTGNDDIPVNPKFKQPVTLKHNDVPKFLAVFNNLPKFKEFEIALKNRLGIVIMNIKEDIPKNEQIRQLEELILNETNTIEWLLYHSLENAKKVLTDKTYKPNWDMSYKTNKEFNNIVGKYSTPIKYILEKGFEYLGEETNFNNETYSNYEDYITNTEMNKFLNKASELEKVQIPQRNTKGQVKPKVITGYINDIFGLKNYERKSKKINGKTQSVYYCLFKTQYYYDIMK